MGYFQMRRSNRSRKYEETEDEHYRDLKRDMDDKGIDVRKQKSSIAKCTPSAVPCDDKWGYHKYY